MTESTQYKVQTQTTEKATSVCLSVYENASMKVLLQSLPV